MTTRVSFFPPLSSLVHSSHAHTLTTYSGHTDTFETTRTVYCSRRIRLRGSLPSSARSQPRSHSARRTTRATTFPRKRRRSARSWVNYTPSVPQACSSSAPLAFYSGYFCFPNRSSPSHVLRAASRLHRTGASLGARGKIWMHSNCKFAQSVGGLLL